MIEGRRLELCEHFRFHPNAAFHRIDRFNNGKVSSLDLATFLKDNGYNYFSIDLADLISSYDRDGDSYLSPDELNCLLLTSTDRVLHQRCFDRYEEFVGIRDKLPSEIERMMTRLIVEEVEGLKLLNKDKEILKSRYDFSRLDAFRAIDNYKLNSILRDDIKYFMNRNGIMSTALDADHLFKRLDLDEDGRITYTEFCDYIEKVGVQLQSGNGDSKYQKSVDQALRESQKQKQANQRIQSDAKNELQANQRMYYKTPQRERANYSNIDYTQSPNFAQTDTKTFNPIEDDEPRRNFILYGVRESNTTPLRKSLTPQNNRANSNKQTSKNNRVRSSNNKSNQNSALFGSSDNNMASLTTTPSPTKGANNNSNINNNQIFDSQGSPVGDSNQRLDLDDIEEEEDKFEEEQIMQEKADANVSDSDQLNQGYFKEESDHDEQVLVSPYQRQYYLETNEEANLAETLIQMITIETQLEKQKQTLALKSDFNLLDAFRLFDRTVSGEIYTHDLEEGLRKLGVYSLDKRELNLFFKRHDKNQDYKIRYLEFTDGFTPKDRIYADHLSNKRPNYEARHPDEAISLKTKLEFGNALRNILRYEGNLEELRILLTSSPLFSINAGFQTLEQSGNGCLTQNDIKEFLESYEFFATQKEIELLFDKIDRDRDGKISYGEFFSEFAPKMAN
eukprot:403376281